MSNEVQSLADHSAWAAVQRAAGPVERYEAGLYAVELVDMAGCRQPVPRLMLDLPWADDDEQTVEQILVGLIVADDIEQVTNREGLRKLKDICDLPVTVFDVRARPGDVDDAKWGAYVSLAVSVDGGTQEAISSGHAQVITTLWRCWCEGRFPVSGRFVKLGKPKVGRDQPIGFQVESAL